MVDVIKFGAPWCSPCKLVEPIMARYADVHPEVLIMDVNIDEDDSLLSQYNILGVPTVVVMDDGVEVDRKVGPDVAMFFR